MIDNNDDRYVSADELSRRFGVSTRTIFRWTTEGLLPEPRRITPRAVRYNLRECMEHIQAKSGEVQQ